MFHLHSRIHRLNHFPDEGCTCYVKRDDELGCGISGTKLRKYASIIPYLMRHSIKHLIIIGGPQSNNLLAAVQLAREFQFTIKAFLIKPKTPQITGNYKLSRLFIEEHDIQWVERDDWAYVNEMAYAYSACMKESCFVLEEGASVAEAMDGAKTLADDIVRNEQEGSLNFNHILIDAGTGFSAGALAHGLDELNHKALVHVLLLADSEAIFKEKIHQWIGYIPSNLHCFKPSTASSFGSVNQTIKMEIQRMAYEEGILVDPIYSAKLFHESRTYVVEKQISGNVLIVHSGGALSLSGFNSIVDK